MNRIKALRNRRMRDGKGRREVRWVRSEIDVGKR
jgi:hypothetical protein